MENKFCVYTGREEMTWKEFKKAVEEQGVINETEVVYIDWPSLLDDVQVEEMGEGKIKIW